MLWHKWLLDDPANRPAFPVQNANFNYWINEFLTKYPFLEQAFFFERVGDVDQVQAVSIKFELTITMASSQSSAPTESQKAFDDFVTVFNEDTRSIEADLVAWHAAFL